jgi:hypothetical protein
VNLATNFGEDLLKDSARCGSLWWQALAQLGGIGEWDMGRRRVRAYLAAMAVPLAIGPNGVAAANPSAVTSPRVLLVGTYRGRPGQYSSIQAAVDAARPGDWVLIAPGDYHEAGAPGAGVLVTTTGLHLRGLDRNGVIVDGTAPGSPPCGSVAVDQVATAAGRNGIEVLKTSGVSIENLTTCNFLGNPTGGNGNQIWWNGGDGSGTIGLGSFRGAFLTASSSYFAPSAGASYGVFVSNASGPGVIEQAYASNMDDSSFYVGACGDCNTTLRHVHAENSALGYSGSNAGGHLTIEESEWDLNRVGILPNTLANDDPPSPQNGACPDRAARSCTIIRDNYVHDNNNANTPALGLTAGSPVGTGIEVSGGRNDTIVGNRVSHQGAWAILLNDYPDPTPPSTPTYCQGGMPRHFYPPFDTKVCYFVAHGNKVAGNVLRGNGFFGNQTNSDLADATIAWKPANCFVRNVDPSAGGLTSAPAHIQSAEVLGNCRGAGSGDVGALSNQLLCAALNLCPDGGTYPQPTSVTLLPISRDQPTMGDPCAGVPSNPWCRDE